MVVDTKLYDLLGVSPDANERELKKAFMLKARELHPDKNRDDPNATEKFQQVNEAYEILKNPDKRKLYDQYGSEGLKQGVNDFDSMNIFDLFNPFRPNRKRGPTRTRDIGHKLKVSLEDLYNGKEVTLRITRNVVCSDCNGSGCKKGKSATKCPNCGGSGQSVNVIRQGPMITQQITTCNKCRGTGESINESDRCTKCKGKKVKEEKKEIVVHIAPGMEDGEHITFQGCSDEEPGAETGDLIVVLEMKKHNAFSRNHDDLLIHKKITLTEALIGTKFPITHLDGRIVVVTTNPGEIIEPNAVKVIQREGMPIKGNQFEKGRLFIKFQVEFPKANSLTPELKAAIAESLPIEDHCKGIDMNDDNVYPVTMKDSDIKTYESAQAHRSRRNEAYNDNSDDDDETHQQASCQPM